MQNPWSDRRPVLATLRPIAWVPVLNGWLVTGRETALQVMRDAETFTVDDPRFSTVRVVGPSMLTCDGPEHTRHREPFAESLRLPAVRARFAPLVQAEVDALIDGFEAEGRTELRRSFAGPLAARVVAQLLRRGSPRVSRRAKPVPQRSSPCATRSSRCSLPRRN